MYIRTATNCESVARKHSWWVKKYKVHESMRQNDVISTQWTKTENNKIWNLIKPGLFSPVYAFNINSVTALFFFSCHNICFFSLLPYSFLVKNQIKTSENENEQTGYLDIYKHLGEGNHSSRATRCWMTPALSDRSCAISWMWDRHIRNCVHYDTALDTTIRCLFIIIEEVIIVITS